MMNRKKAIVLLSVIGLVIIGAGFFYFYPKYQENKFFIKTFGLSKEEMRFKLTDQAREFSVYLKPVTTEDEAVKIVNLIKAQGWAESVLYISSDQALAEFKERNTANPNIIQALKELETNPLLASIKIKIVNCSLSKMAVDFMPSLQTRTSVGRVSYPSIGCEDIENNLEKLYSASRAFFK